MLICLMLARGCTIHLPCTCRLSEKYVCFAIVAEVSKENNRLWGVLCMHINQSVLKYLLVVYPALAITKLFIIFFSDADDVMKF